MAEKRSYDLKLVAAIAVAFVIASAIFAFYLGKRFQDEAHKALETKVEQERQKERSELSEKIKQRDVQLAKISEHEYILERQLKEREKEYARIDKKYDRKTDSIITLPMDAKVKFFADWLSEVDSTQWRHADSNN